MIHAALRLKALAGSSNFRWLSRGSHEVTVQMTLAAPGCVMSEGLKDQVEIALLDVPWIKRTKVKFPVDPRWAPSRISEAASLDLGLTWDSANL